MRSRVVFGFRLLETEPAEREVFVPDYLRINWTRNAGWAG